MVKKNLVLLGMMAVGKTTLGKIVAINQGLEFIDTDTAIEKKNSMTIKQIFEEKGEKFFRMQEKKEVLKILKKKNCVIALGGGAFLNDNLRKNILKDALSIWLDVDLKTINESIKWNKKRPLLNTEKKSEKVNDLYSERKNIYELAEHKINCKNLSKNKIVDKIIKLYAKQ